MSKDFKTYDINSLYPLHDDVCCVRVACRRDQFSASAIARAVEDCDAHLLNLNVMRDDSGVADMMVDLRVNSRSAASIVRSLERYGFDVVEVETHDGEAAVDPTLRERVDELLRYINI